MLWLLAARACTVRDPRGHQSTALRYVTKTTYSTVALPDSSSLFFVAVGMSVWQGVLLVWEVMSKTGVCVRFYIPEGVFEVGFETLFR
jgi:hypothetical protein